MDKKPNPKDFNQKDKDKPGESKLNQPTRTPGMSEPGTTDERLPVEIRPSPPEEYKGPMVHPDTTLPRTTDPNDTPGEDVVDDTGPKPVDVVHVTTDAQPKPDPRKRRVASPTKVRALKMEYGERRRKMGDVFMVEAGERLGTWMEPVSEDTPLRTQSQAESIRSQDEARRMSGTRKLQPNAADYTADERDHKGGDVL